MQGPDQALQQLPALRLQLVGIEGKQHPAADADAAVVQGHPTTGERNRQGLFQGHAALFFHLAFFYFLFEMGGQLQLHAQHTHQNQDEGAQEARHQVAEDGPD